jgi:predicted ribosomally synthesized peptide with nif11-like leader
VSVQSALQFIAAVRSDDTLRQRVAECRLGGLPAVVAIGCETGYQFSEDELRRAHAHDWSMRWARAHQRRVVQP